jgi:hypothetical protein
MELLLESGETDLLKRVLNSYLSELRGEIGKTDDYDFRQGLKQDEEQIKSLLARLDRAKG